MMRHRCRFARCIRSCDRSGVRCGLTYQSSIPPAQFGETDLAPQTQPKLHPATRAAHRTNPTHLAHLRNRERFIDVPRCAYHGGCRVGRRVWVR